MVPSAQWWCYEGEEKEEEEEEEAGLFKADAVNEEDPERDRATQEEEDSEEEGLLGGSEVED